MREKEVAKEQFYARCALETRTEKSSQPIHSGGWSLDLGCDFRFLRRRGFAVPARVSKGGLSCNGPRAESRDLLLPLRLHLVETMVESSASSAYSGVESMRVCLWLAKSSSGREINSLHSFLNPPICYDCSLCSDFSASGWEQSSGFFDHGKIC